MKISSTLIFILFYYTHYYAVVGFDIVSAFSYSNRHEIVSNYSRARIPHNKSCNPPIQTPPPATIILHSSPLDDFLDNIFGNDDNNKKNSDGSSTNNEDNNNRLEKDENEEENENDMSLSSFQQELAKRQTNIEAPNDQQQQQQQQQLESPNSGSSSSSSSSVQIKVQQEEEEKEEFDGYDLRDIINAKYGVCYDVEFQRVDVGGFRSVYLVRISYTCLFVFHIYLHAGC